MAAPKPGGFKLSFANAKNKDALKPKQSAPLAKRPRLALDDDEPEDTSKSQAISGWDTATGGAIDLNGKKKEEKAPLVIPALPNRNWRTEANRKQQPGKEEEKVEEEQPKIQYGLITFKKQEDDGQEDQAMTEAPAPPPPVDDGLTEEERLDKMAREALKNGKAEEHTVIPHVTEEEAFQNDVKDAPEPPSLAAYEATPIDGFGAALLRGMGWKDGEEIGRNKGTTFKPKEIKRRPALLGIGAKEEAAVGIELGAWGNNSKGKGRQKVDQSFNPVVLRNKHTGETVTEEELKKQLEAQQLVDEEEQKGGKKSSKREETEEERDRRKRKSKYDDYSDDERRRERRYKEKRDRDRRDRSEDKDDRKRDRRRDDYDDRKREKRRDDYPDDDRRREKRRDREYSDDERRREKRRERRDRSRSPDRDSERKRRRDYDYEDEREDRKRRHRYDDDRRSTRK